MPTQSQARKRKVHKRELLLGGQLKIEYGSHVIAGMHVLAIRFLIWAALYALIFLLACSAHLA